MSRFRPFFDITNMKTKTIELYSFNELSKEAQLKAHSAWIANNDYFFLSDTMAEWLHELLEKNGIKDQNDTSKAGTKPTPVMYSLSNSQGDGCMFEGIFEWKGHTVNIKHSGHYTHSHSKNIEIVGNDGLGAYEESNYEELYAEFENIYQDICKELERRGYDFIENEDSLENFIESCELNDWTFTSEGIMEN